jgi:hypothetical protein
MITKNNLNNNNNNMKFHYLDFIVQSTKKYQKNLAYLICIVSFLFFLLIVSYTNDPKLNNYSKVFGSVQSIEKDNIKMKSTMTFKFKKKVFVGVVSIKINDSYYYIDQQYKNNWNDILNNIFPNDYVEGYYRTEEGYDFLVHIQKNNSPVLSINETKEGRKKILIFFSVLFVIFLFILVTMIYQRRAWLKKGNVTIGPFF